jgi:hypothetical protein
MFLEWPGRISSKPFAGLALYLNQHRQPGPYRGHWLGFVFAQNGKPIVRCTGRDTADDIDLGGPGTEYTVIAVIRNSRIRFCLFTSEHRRFFDAKNGLA